MNLDASTILLGGGMLAAFGLIASVWGRIKSFFLAMTRYLIVEVEITDVALQCSLLQLLRRYYKKSRFTPRVFVTGFMFLRSRDQYQHIPFEAFSSVKGVFWRGAKPLWVSSKSPTSYAAANSSEKDTIKSSGEGESGPLMTIRYIRGTLDIEKTVIDSVQIINDLDHNRYSVEHIHGSGSRSGNSSPEYSTNSRGETDISTSWMIFQQSHVPLDADWDHIGPHRRVNPMGDMILSTKAEEVVEDIRHWIESREWFRDRAIPWRRGYLLYGEPGCGKTSFVRAVAEEFNLPLFVFDLASLSNSELAGGWTRANATAPLRIMLIEDIDSIFDGRRNKVSNQHFLGVTFDKLLNTIDGVEQQEGLLVFITTNDVKNIDPAIGSTEEFTSRPGRIDRVVEFARPGSKGLAPMAVRIFGADSPHCEQLLREGGNDTPAQFQERCIRVALLERFDT